MRRTLFSVVCAATVSLSTMAGAADLDCPDASMVMDETHADAGYLTKLSEKLGEIDPTEQSLRLVAGDIRTELPAVQDAEVADIMIAAYCAHLNTSAHEAQKSETAVAAFEQDTYAAVFGATPPPEYKRQGWLYGN